MYKSGSTKLVRNLNTQHVLNLVRINPGTTARNISNITGLQMSTVLYTLHALEKKGLIENTGFGNSTFAGGKPPQMWSISPGYGYIIGLELLSSEIRLVLINFNGELQYKERFPLQPVKNPALIYETITQEVRATLDENKIDKNHVLGMGVAVPGSIDHNNGIVRYSYTLGFQETEIRSLLENLLNISIQIDNDANAGALGIKWHSQEDQELSDILYLSINQNFSGMGAGFIVNHQLYRGAHSAAGEIAGFMPHSIWRQFLKRASKKYGENCLICSNSSSQIPLVADVIEMAKKGDPGAIFILKEVAKQISKKLVPLLDLFDPDLVVIGGDICEAKEYINEIIQDRVKANVLSDCVRYTPIRFSPFGTFSVAMGSTALILQEIFNTEN